jgi:hypothetical protein
MDKYLNGISGRDLRASAGGDQRNDCGHELTTLLEAVIRRKIRDRQLQEY